MKTPPNILDSQIGKNLKVKRIESGLSQQDLANFLDVSFQQIQKYERGQNKIAGSSLYQISKALGVSIAEFFDNLEQVDFQDLKEDNQIFEYIDNLSDYEVTTLVKNYSRIEDKNIRKKIMDLTKSLNLNFSKDRQDA